MQVKVMMEYNFHDENQINLFDGFSLWFSFDY